MSIYVAHKLIRRTIGDVIAFSGGAGAGRRSQARAGRSELGDSFPGRLSAQWRFIGKAGLDNNDPDPSLFGASVRVLNEANAQLPNMSYLDLSAIYTVYEGISIRAGVNNVLDEDPPIIAVNFSGGAGTPNTLPSYDLLGRQAFVGFTAKF